MSPPLIYTIANSVRRENLAIVIKQKGAADEDNSLFYETLSAKRRISMTNHISDILVSQAPKSPKPKRFSYMVRIFLKLFRRDKNDSLRRIISYILIKTLQHESVFSAQSTIGNFADLGRKRTWELLHELEAVGFLRIE